MVSAAQISGTVVSIRGSVVDARFSGEMPRLEADFLRRFMELP